MVDRVVLVVADPVGDDLPGIKRVNRLVVMLRPYPGSIQAGDHRNAEEQKVKKLLQRQSADEHAIQGTAGSRIV